MINEQTFLTAEPLDVRKPWPPEEGAGPFAALGVFILFVVGIFMFSSVVGQFGGEPAAIYPSLAVPPLVAMVIAYWLRSRWWVLYTTLPPVLVGGLFLFGGDWITAVGGVVVALGVINAVLMAIATAIGQRRYRAHHPVRADQIDTSLLQNQTIPADMNPLNEW